MRTKTTPAKVLATATTLVLMWTLAACATPATEVETATEPIDEPAEGIIDESAGDVEPAAADRASDIPLPEGALVVDERVDPATGADTMLVHVPGEYEGHAEFYRAAMPGAGWEIVSESPTQGGSGVVFEVTNDTTRAWIQCENFDAGTAISISTNALDAPAQQPGLSAESAANVDLPDGFPADVALPLHVPSTMVAGGDHGGEMRVLEYVATATDIPSVTAVIDQEVIDKDWTVMDLNPEDERTTYILERSGWELILVLLPERTNTANASLHYTLHLLDE